MKPIKLCVSAAFTAVALAVFAAAPPPLKVDKSAPLLLDDAPAKTAPVSPKLICYDCHGTFREDPFSIKHASVNITCVTCHGESRAHADDEDNTTPPQTMFPREAIAKRCAECHKEHNVAPSKVIARWQERGLQKLTPSSLVCTDCHGKHRMNVRTIHWDKKTGKLLDAPKKAAK
ncbi:MAG: cytochrome c3 family protein [Verrucomicrobiia bacterium]